MGEQVQAEITLYDTDTRPELLNRPRPSPSPGVTARLPSVWNCTSNKHTGTVTCRVLCKVVHIITQQQTHQLEVPTAAQCVQQGGWHCRCTVYVAVGWYGTAALDCRPLQHPSERGQSLVYCLAKCTCRNSSNDTHRQDSRSPRTVHEGQATVTQAGAQESIRSRQARKSVQPETQLGRTQTTNVHSCYTP